jgi:hypothetical protein
VCDVYHFCCCCFTVVVVTVCLEIHSAQSLKKFGCCVFIFRKGGLAFKKILTCLNEWAAAGLV